jgi:hypothetical protein
MRRIPISQRLRVIAVALVLILGANSVVTPRKAEGAYGLALFAVVGMLGAAPVLVTAGLSVTFLITAASVGSGIEFFKTARGSSGGKAALHYLLAAGAAVGGLIILDGPEAGGLRLDSLSDPQALELGLTDLEHRAYEQELPLINAVAEEAVARTEAAFLNRSHSGSEDQVILTLHSHWVELSGQALSPEAVSAVRKIGAGVANKLSGLKGQ